DTERDLSRAEPLIEERLDDLRRVHASVRDRLKDHVILEPFCHVACADVYNNACIISVITAYVVAQQPVKHRHKISRLAPFRRDSRLDQDFVVTVEERAITAILCPIERRCFDARRDAVESFAVEQGEIQRRERIVVGMPHRSSMHPMSDVVPHVVSFDSYPDCVSTRRLVERYPRDESTYASCRH